MYVNDKKKYQQSVNYDTNTSHWNKFEGLKDGAHTKNNGNDVAPASDMMDEF